GNIQMSSVAGGGNILGLNAGTTGTISVTGLTDNVSTLTITNSNGATFGDLGTGTAGAVTITDTEDGATVSFGGTTNITTLTTTANGYNVSFGGNTTVTNDASFL
ncbi:hypothetical protein RZS08_04660, partial [Arthrospira platensis SPKY1]|nr:hypothetical protein [Arthrospira platensis SPKY1]